MFKNVRRRISPVNVFTKHSLPNEPKPTVRLCIASLPTSEEHTKWGLILGEIPADRINPATPANAKKDACDSRCFIPFMVPSWPLCTTRATRKRRGTRPQWSSRCRKSRKTPPPTDRRRKPADRALRCTAAESTRQLRRAGRASFRLPPGRIGPASRIARGETAAAG